MKPSYSPIAPISLPSSPLYRPVTIMLYNTCHSHCAKHLKGISVTLQGPYTHTLYILQSTCLPSWRPDLRLRLFFLIEAFSVSSLGHLSSPISGPTSLLFYKLCIVFSPSTSSRVVSHTDTSRRFSCPSSLVPLLRTVTKHLHHVCFSSYSHVNYAPADEDVELRTIFVRHSSPALR
jgi:hypothetical protein